VRPFQLNGKQVMAGSPSHQGHHHRLRKKFLTNGITALHDYEIIELLLSYILPRKDTKPLAKELLGTYKTVTNLLNQQTQTLVAESGLTDRTALYFSVLRELITYCLKEKCLQQPVVNNREAVEEYLIFTFGHRKDEYIAGIFLDNQNHIIHSEILAEGTVNQCVLHKRLVFEKAFTYGASALILAHNHPGGGMEPSESDWRLTKEILEIGKKLNVNLLDHLITTKTKTVSLRNSPRWPSVVL